MPTRTALAAWNAEKLRRLNTGCSETAPVTGVLVVCGGEWNRSGRISVLRVMSVWMRRLVREQERIEVRGRRVNIWTATGRGRT